MVYLFKFQALHLFVLACYMISLYEWQSLILSFKPIF